MFAAVKKLFSPPAYQEEAHRAYVAIVEQARRPWFYQEQCVADTLDGRFDVIILHLFLVIYRLDKQHPEFERALSEAFIADMDRSLREMGVGDMGVGKRVKKMAQAYLGRLDAYARSFDDRDTFITALRRNLYRTGEDISYTASVYEYCQRNRTCLAGQSLESLVRGQVVFTD